MPGREPLRAVGVSPKQFRYGQSKEGNRSGGHQAFTAATVSSQSEPVSAQSRGGNKDTLQTHIEGRCAIVNPFGAVLPQNKRAMAFFWERLPRFSPAAQAAIRAFIPRTVRLEAADPTELQRRRDRWVLKSDYGCEGAEVLIGAHLTQAEWEEALAMAVPGHWIAQRYFEVAPDPLGRTVNAGVYLIAGRAAGFFSRAQDGATDYSAQTAATLIEP